jgi:hypothetical protein
LRNNQDNCNTITSISEWPYSTRPQIDRMSDLYTGWWAMACLMVAMPVKVIKTVRMVNASTSVRTCQWLCHMLWINITLLPCLEMFQTGKGRDLLTLAKHSITTCKIKSTTLLHIRSLKQARMVKITKQARVAKICIKANGQCYWWLLLCFSPFFF